MVEYRMVTRDEQVFISDEPLPAEVTLDIYSTEGMQIRDKKSLTVVIPGFLQKSSDDPLPDIAVVSAELEGLSGVLSYPYHPSDNIWETPAMQYKAIREVLMKLKGEGIQRFKMIGFSIGGAVAINSIASIEDKDLFPTCEGILSLGSPLIEDFRGLPYFYTNMSYEERLHVGSRGRTISYYAAINQSKLGLTRESVEKLKRDKVRITSIQIHDDQVVEADDILMGKGVRLKKVRLNTEGLNSGEVHRWVGEENRLKLKKVVQDFL